ncbi:MAG: hypothetical protein CUN53_00115 [Phototrophicales bacterium]|nr:MAG: hypothetical protein CUN53_00115 [Phototrophicales bacterium]
MLFGLGQWGGETYQAPYPLAPSADTCISLQCGMPGSVDLRFACSQAGYVGSRSCGDPACLPWLDNLRSLGICAPASAPSTSTSTTPTPAPSTSTSTTPTLAPPLPPPPAAPVQVIQSGRVVTLDPITTPVQVKRDEPDATPLVQDGTPATMVPAAVRLPNIWDRLDPSKPSLLWREGPARALPVWASAQFADSLRPVPAADPEAPGGQLSPWWIVAGLVLAGALISSRRGRYA